MISSITYPGCEAFVQPQFVPPIHGDEIAEPLMGELVRYDVHHTIAILLIRRILVEQNGSCAVGDETPVLHGTV